MNRDIVNRLIWLGQLPPSWTRVLADVMFDSGSLSINEVVACCFWCVTFFWRKAKHSKSNRRPHPNTILRRARALGYQFGAADAAHNGSWSKLDPFDLIQAHDAAAAFYRGYTVGYAAFREEGTPQRRAVAVKMGAVEETCIEGARRRRAARVA